MNEVSFSRTVKSITLGSWKLDPKRQVLTDGDIEKELEPLLFRIISYLILNSDTIITRQNLVEDVWCQKYVDDNAINRAMSELRKTLKSENQKGMIVKTHYRKGYSLAIEPFVEYHQTESTENTKLNPAVSTEIKAKAITAEPPHRRKKTSWVLGALFSTLAVSISVALLSQNNDPDNVPVNAIEKQVQETVLSWVNGRYTRPNISPNKNFVAFSIIQKNSQNYSLVVKTLQTGHEKRLAEDGTNYFPIGWSADSNKVFYRAINGEQCEVWLINASFDGTNQYLFDCSLQGFTGAGVSDGRLIYSKSGYRDRDELAALASRDISTGQEYQITSPNLNSYGDRFLTYLPDLEVIIFERHHYQGSELYMTDLDGGNQVKLYDTDNRIWSLSYEKKHNALIWFDNVENILFTYSLDKKKVISAAKLPNTVKYASNQPLSHDELLAVTYPFLQDVYTLSPQGGELHPLINSEFDDIHAADFEDSVIFLRQQGGLRSIYRKSPDGQYEALALPASNYESIHYSAQRQELLVRYNNKLETYDAKTLELSDSISVDGTIVSAEYLEEDNIGYSVVDAKTLRGKAFMHSLDSDKSIALPIERPLWFGQLNSQFYASLSSHDEVSLYDINTGEKADRIELSKAKYKHSITAGNGALYHSDGETVFRINFGEQQPKQEIYKVDSSSFVIDRIRFSQKTNALYLDIIEVVENQLVKADITAPL
ncbi:winged helix-turn-helix domain-containing protein [Pseudoalteromonas sp. OOF1S-7]|uniref:winged helix-turn-helix domain-containing protein n=1 Tax=Pseudoalteromonas sp. OOF1S-7 TaxID=2917757 RepID=UPI001EF5CDAE|nr:winged helix-turn-helix domain-containing protein [Pseudoalteromonas sp. OOF1S-7]MCG7537729.1 winged helix-turn-helix domain-containing protein [Pseudoalteromonas sp. OOF1S-7]